MKNRRTINSKIIIVLLSLFLLNIFGWLLNYLITIHAKKYNVAKIDHDIHMMGYAQDTIEQDLQILDNLLSLRHLTVFQIGQISMLKSTLYYTNNDMNSFFNTVGTALFYSEKAGTKDDLVYLYANMAKYFHEMGDIDEAEAMINKAFSIRSFYECENIFTKLQALQVYSRVAVEKNDFETALRAADQIIENSESDFINSFNQNFSVYYRRSGEIVKALVSLEKADYKNALEQANLLHEKYFSQDEIVSQFNAFDFYLPLLYVQTLSTAWLGDFKASLNYLKQYSDFVTSISLQNLSFRFQKKFC